MPLPKSVSEMKIEVNPTDLNLLRLIKTFPQSRKSGKLQISFWKGSISQIKITKMLDNRFAEILNYNIEDIST